MSNIKFLYTAYTLFSELLEENFQPVMTGCYQWIRVFKGEAKAYNELQDSDLENYDAIMVNLDGADCRLATDLRRRLGKSSSTKIIANQDYSPDVFNSGYKFFEDLIGACKDADAVFATSPSGKGMLDSLTGINSFLIPHPCETHVLKRVDSIIENDWVLVFWHRYSGDTIIPYSALKNAGFDFGLIGWLKEQDPNFARTVSYYPIIIHYTNFLNFIKIMKEARYGLFVPNSYTYGRIPCDMACAGRPLVVSNTIWSGRICYPLTTVDPYDVVKMRNLLFRLRDEPEFYSDVCNIAKYNSEFFSHENSRLRFLNMLEKCQKD